MLRLWYVMCSLIHSLNKMHTDDHIEFKYALFTVNELIVEILGEVFGEEDDDNFNGGGAMRSNNRHILLRQSTAHLGLTPQVLDLFHHFFRINPANRWTLAQVIQSDYVQNANIPDDR